MTVKDLIKKLEKCDQGAEVYCGYDTYDIVKESDAVIEVLELTLQNVDTEDKEVCGVYLKM